MSRKAGSKKPKDPNAPKGALSSYFIFSNERRSVLMGEHKDKKITEISKIISAEWKEMSDAEKGVYQQRSKDAKVEYKLKFEEYKKTDHYATHQSKLRLWEQNQKDAKRNQAADGKPTKKISMPRKPKDANAPKKSVSSYFLFAQGARDKVRSENPSLKVTEIAKLLGQKWKELSDEEKVPFTQESLRLKEEWKVKMAAYVGSEQAREYQKRLEEWKVECDKRTRAFEAKQTKARMKQKAAKRKSSKSPKSKKTKKKMEVVESSSDESDSDSDSSSSSESSSGSSSSGSSDESSSSSDSD